MFFNFGWVIYIIYRILNLLLIKPFNIFLNNIRRIYINSLYKRDYIFIFNEHKYTFFEIEFFCFFIMYGFFFITTIYIEFFSDFNLVNNCFGKLPKNKLSYPGSLGQHTLYLFIEVEQFWVDE